MTLLRRSTITLSLVITFQLGSFAPVFAQPTNVAEGKKVENQDLAVQPIPQPTTLGMVKKKPENGLFVETRQGYMVPYKSKIPGSEVEFEMLPIPGGRFRMGSPDSEPDRRTDEGPQFEVVVEPFWMGKYEVTWAEYKLYMKLDRVFKAFRSRNIRPAEFSDIDAVTAPSSLYEPSYTFEAGEEPNQPAATMSLYAAQQYTKWLSLLSGDFYCLPTEAQWEYACRAGTTTSFYFGNEPDQLEEHAWFIDNADELRQVVGKLKPNPWGLYDMYGNVAEWTLDAYNENGYGEDRHGKSLTIGQALVRPGKVFPTVLRGGSWELEAEDCRSAARLPSSEDWRDEDPNYPQSPWWFTTSPGLGAGFRIIRPLDVPPNRKQMELCWEPQVARILKDAKNRITDKGKGALGIADPDLPAAIKQLTDEDR